MELELGGILVILGGVAVLLARHLPPAPRAWTIAGAGAIVVGFFFPWIGDYSGFDIAQHTEKVDPLGLLPGVLFWLVPALGVAAGAIGALDHREKYHLTALAGAIASTLTFYQVSSLWWATGVAAIVYAASSVPRLHRELRSNFEDDSAASHWVRLVDAAIGLVEQFCLFVLLLFLVFVTCGWFIGDQLAHHTSITGPAESFAMASYDVRYTCFLLAMMGGAFAAHHRRLLSMDFVSHFLGARTRAWTRLLNTIFAAMISGTFLRYALYVYDYESHTEQKEHWMPAFFANAAMAIGATMLCFHLAMQVVIEADYHIRKKLPPEPQMGAH